MSTTEAAQDLNERFIPDLKIDLIEYSPNNPRKFLDKDKLEELAKSILQHGVVEPIVVRPHPKHKTKYELVAGERRHRASVIAKKDSIPSIIRSYTDQQAAEVQQIENLQRADIHFMDEAHGFKNLIERFTYTPQSIADKIGKPLSYVVRRMKLADLIEPLIRLCWKDDLPLSYAEYLCRFSDKDQVFIEKELLWDFKDSLTPLLSLKREVEERLMADVSTAPWKMKDDFVQFAPACLVCPKRSGNALVLFPELEKDPNRCTDRACFEGKLSYFIDQKLTENPKLVGITDNWRSDKKEILGSDAYSAKSRHHKKCKSDVKGIYVQGHTERLGRIVAICLDPKCPDHKGWVSSGQQAARMREERVKAAGRQAAFLAFWGAPDSKFKDFDLESLRMIVEYVHARAYNGDKVSKAVGFERTGKEGSYKHYNTEAFFKKATREQLIRSILVYACNADVDHNTLNDLGPLAKRLSIDIVKPRVAAEKEVLDKQKKYLASRGKGDKKKAVKK